MRIVIATLISLAMFVSCVSAPQSESVTSNTSADSRENAPNPIADQVDEYLRSRVNAAIPNFDESQLVPKHGDGEIIPIENVDSVRNVVQNRIGYRLVPAGNDGYSAPRTGPSGIDSIVTMGDDLYEAESLRWYISGSYNGSINALDTIAASLSTDEVAEVTFRRYLVLDVAPDSLLKYREFYAGLYTLLRDENSNLQSEDRDRQVAIRSIILDIFQARKYKEWTADLSISGAIIGIGGELYMEETNEVTANHWQGYYVVESIRGIWEAYIVENQTEQLARRTLSSDSLFEDPNRASEFYDLATAPDFDAAVLGRRLGDPSFLESVDTIQWNRFESPDSLEVALAFEPVELLRQDPGVTNRLFPENLPREGSNDIPSLQQFEWLMQNANNPILNDLIQERE
jgi:Na+-transporting methylmalonyl-CoA/oxaloacetate decarboxylase gamma subunit